jgi:glutamine amidotransferase
MITIVDYGMGNVGSIASMLKHVGAPHRIESDPAAIARADKVILPGVGAFDAAMERIDADGMRGALDECALRRRVPVLGICLGMQLLTRSSEEGQRAGLGWIDATARAFRACIAGPMKVPHMGWNAAVPRGRSPLTDGLDDASRFYFVHSYFVICGGSQRILETTYGIDFDAAIQQDNIFGVQFHPEKSHRYGMRVLRNFAGL